MPPPSEVMIADVLETKGEYSLKTKGKYYFVLSFCFPPSEVMMADVLKSRKQKERTKKSVRYVC